MTHQHRSGRGRLILLNGSSSAGKSTLVRAIQARLMEETPPHPFLRFSLDTFMFGGEVLPAPLPRAGPGSWAAIRPRLFEGYYGCLAALLEAGNDLVIDLIVETPQQWATLTHLLSPGDVYFVGVFCPLDELERRERARGDRPVGDAARDLKTVHTFGRYDLEIDSSGETAAVAAQVVEGWKGRGASVFGQAATAGG